MDKIVYTQEKMDAVKTQVQKLVEIVAELEAEQIKRINPVEKMKAEYKNRK